MTITFRDTVTAMRWLLRTFGFSLNDLGIWWNRRSGTTRFISWGELFGRRRKTGRPLKPAHRAP